jgi:2-keto-3-deoxy-L-rhamnonate aldolase RhmA
MATPPRRKAAAQRAAGPASVYPAGGPGRQLKARLRAGEVLVGGILAEFARPSLVRQYADAGFDFLYIETEHLNFSPPALNDTVFVARCLGLPAIAKIGQLERAETARLLDCGIVGIQLPRTESREQIEGLRDLIKFPPKGSRAAAPGFGNSDYRQQGDVARWLREQDEETLLVVHIETKVGYDNAEAIVTTPGVDMVYVGPGDSTVELGHPGEPDHPAVVAEMEKVLRLCLRHKIPFGTTASGAAAARRWIDKGASFFEAVDELALIYEGASRLVGEYRKLIQRRAVR